MNRTIKEATVQRFYDETDHESSSGGDLHPLALN